MTEKNKNWKEEAWEKLLRKKWDNKAENASVVIYSKKDLAPILSKYTKSGQGEIRIFHSGHEKVNAVKRRNVMKVPIGRGEWALVQRPPKLDFTEPKEIVEFNPVKSLTEGMRKGIDASLKSKSNPGETTLLAIAKHIGLISNFYNLESEGVWFTGGRQNASGTKIIVNNKELDLSKAQIEIDGGFEWANKIILVEMKSSFGQDEFDVNQILIPMLKWQGLLMSKKVYSLVLLAETTKNKLIYYAYDVIQDDSKGPFGMRIKKSKKYTIIIKN